MTLGQLKFWLSKIQVPAEPGLSTAQLMLTNDDLRPGECVTLMIAAIWPSYNNLPNSIPTSSGVTTKQFVSFLLFWLLSLPALWFPIYKVRHLFTVKAYFSPACAIAFFGWAIARAHGLGPIIDQSNQAHGSALAWAFVKSIMSCIANFAALVINNPDFTRYARDPKDALWPQLITIPVGFAVTSFIGIIVSSSSSVIFGQAVWNPLTLLGMFLQDASSAERFGIFVIAAGFALAQLGTNIAANSVSAGTNLTALLPRFCTIRRGGYLCAAIGLAMCPSPAQAQTLREHIIPTILPGTAEFRDLLCRTHTDPEIKDQYIIKPSRDARGTGILLGRNLSTEKWQSILISMDSQNIHSLATQYMLQPMLNLRSFEWF
ncbi:unnamed protein product [Penicillium viridicatum]